MNKQDILNEINKTKEHLANMEKMLEECKYGRRKPEEREECFYVDNLLFIQNTAFESHDSYHQELWDSYNCFKTKEEAEQEAEKILIRRILEDIARRLNKGEEIDWNDGKQYKYYLNYAYSTTLHDEDCILQHVRYMTKQQGTVYCLDENFLDVAIQEIGEERLKKYLRGE